MQVLLIAQDKLPLKESIAKILDSDKKINRLDIVPQAVIFDTKKNFADSFIYVDRSPSRSIVDKLQETKRPLILIANADYRSQLFIPFDDFFAPKYLRNFCENILSLSSPYDIECQRNFFPRYTQSNANNGYSSTSNNQMLTDIEKQVFNTWIRRENRIIAASRLNISLRTYYRILEKLKDLSYLSA